MLELLQVILLAISSLGLGWAALQDYRNGQSSDIMSGYLNYHYAYLFTFVLFVLALSTYYCLPLLIIYLLAIAFLFTRTLGNKSKLAFALFAFSLFQQFALGYYSTDPRGSFIFLSIWYFFGGFFMPILGFSVFAPILRRSYPDQEHRHQNWLRMKMGDVTYGFEKSESILKTNYQYNQNSRFKFTPANLAGSLIAYSIWSVLLTIVFFIYF